MSDQEMQYTDCRLKSFADPAWPYKGKRTKKYKGLAQSLAAAGFYFSPSSTLKDRCLCFLCSKPLSGMDAQDDLLALHSAANSTCPLVLIGEQVAGTSFEETRWSKNMQSARVRTFKDWWPHPDSEGDSLCIEKVRGKILSARWLLLGFVILETLRTLITVYADTVELNWVAGKNQMIHGTIHLFLTNRTEHMKRNPNCIFLSDPDAAPIEEDERQLEERVEEKEEEIVAIVEPPKKRSKNDAAKKEAVKKTKAKKSITKKKTAKSSSASESEDGNVSDCSMVSTASSTTKKTRFEIDEEEEADDVFEFQDASIADIILAGPSVIATAGEDKSLVVILKKRGGKKRANVIEDSFDTSIVESVADESMVSVVGEAKAKRGGRRKKNEADESILDESVSVDPVKRGRKKKAGVEDATILDESMVSNAEETDEVKPKRTTRRKKNEADESILEESMVVDLAKPKRGRKKKVDTEDASILDESMIPNADEVVEEVKPKRAGRSKKNAADESIAVEPVVKPKRGGKKKKAGVAVQEDDVSILDDSMVSVADGEEEVKPKRTTRRKKNEADESVLDESMSVDPVEPKRGRKKKAEAEDASILDDSMISVAESVVEDEGSSSKPTRTTRGKKPVVKVPSKTAASRSKRGGEQSESKQASPAESVVDEEEEPDVFEDAADHTIMLLDDSMMEAPVTVQQLARAIDVGQPEIEEDVVADKKEAVDEKENNPDKFARLISTLTASKITLDSLPTPEDILVLLSDGTMGALDGGVLTDEQLLGNYVASGEHYLREQMAGIKERFRGAVEECVEFFKV